MAQIIDDNIVKFEQWIMKAHETGDNYAFIDPAYELLNEIEEQGNSIDYVEPIFQLIERCPDIDYGGPGPFGTFLERLDGHNNSKELRKSLQRKPMPYTVYLLERVCRSENAPQRNECLLLLKDLLTRLCKDENEPYREEYLESQKYWFS
jgi:hypothetical protein